MMNALEKYLFENHEDYMKKTLDRYFNDFTSVAGKTVRMSCIVSINNNIKTGYRYLNLLVIDLDDKVRVITVKAKIGDVTDEGQIIKEVKLNKAHLRPFYAIFYLLNHIREEKEKK